jgi:hypothetical protein
MLSPQKTRPRAQPAPPTAGMANTEKGLLPSTKDCMRVRGSGRTCDICGTASDVVHVPLFSFFSFIS